MCRRGVRPGPAYPLQFSPATREEINAVPRGNNRTHRSHTEQMPFRESDSETPYATFLSKGFWHLPDEKIQALGEPVD